MKSTPPCRGRHDLFDSTDPRDHRVARQICATCPLIVDCRQLLRDVKAEAIRDGGPAGTWAGLLLRPTTPRKGAA